MNSVIGFADFIGGRAYRVRPDGASHQKHTPTSFTLRDREDLADWSGNGHRASICSSEMGTFAMLYEAGRAWASWGVVRQGRSVLLWDCVTLADIGRFPNMIDALAAVRVDDMPAPVANVLRFAGARTAPDTFA